jgi:predicted nucleic acid-binding protein
VLIVDAGPLYASAAAKDKNHAVCDELLDEAPGPLVVPHLIVAEVAYLLATRIGPHAEIATLDHRHFSVVRPKHVDSFILLP